MNFDDTVHQRRSIRTYLNKDVPQDLLRRILEYGHAAPTAGNIQPWEFVIIRDEKRKKIVVDTTFTGRDETNGKPQQWMLSAPLFIAVCGNRKKIMERYGETSLDSLLYLDCSACIENMLLGAVHLGLASCYVSGFRRDELSKVLNLPEGYEPIALLPIGYPYGVCSERPKIGIDSIIHQEMF